MLHRALLGCVAAAACSHGWRAARTPSPRDPVLAATDDRAAFAAADAKLDRITGTTARIGNRVELLIDGATSFARRLANARDADVILVKTFAFTDDETGRAVADLLIERAKAGAYVVVQYDAIGSIHDPGDVAPMLENGNEKPIISRLRAAGIDVQATNAPAGKVELDQIAGGLARTVLHPIEHLGIVLDRTHRLEFHDHEKYWITGHRGQLTAIIGGMNIGSEYAFGGADRVDAVTGARGWHDVDVEVAGPVVNDIVARYFAVLDDHRGARADHARWNPPQAPAGNARVRFVFNHPRFHNTHAIDEAYAALVDATPQTGVVRIETAYFAPSDLLRGRLHAALRRGTRLAVISNLETNDTAPVAEGTWFVYHALLDVDPSAALYQRVARPDLGEVMIHCKVASFGTRGPVVIGSANLDGQSGEHNSEAVLVIDDPSLREQFDAMFDQDLAPDRATRVTRDMLEGDSTWTRFRQWAVFNLGKSWL
ncbi:MAG TPA: phosphatidylserine/phosphatidylglycerophosphate/cardiolipin synthase family protein [Kofleriaceae bacterium]